MIPHYSLILASYELYRAFIFATLVFWLGREIGKACFLKALPSMYVVHCTRSIHRKFGLILLETCLVGATFIFAYFFHAYFPHAKDQIFIVHYIEFRSPWDGHRQFVVYVQSHCMSTELFRSLIPLPL